LRGWFRHRGHVAARKVRGVPAERLERQRRFHRQQRRRFGPLALHGSDEISHLGSAINRNVGIPATLPKAKTTDGGTLPGLHEQHPAIASIKDREGRILYINEPLSRVYQVKFEDVQGKTNYHWLFCGNRGEDSPP